MNYETETIISASYSGACDQAFFLHTKKPVYRRLVAQAVVHGQKQKHTTKISVGFHNHNHRHPYPHFPPAPLTVPRCNKTQAKVCMENPLHVFKYSCSWAISFSFSFCLLICFVSFCFVSLNFCFAVDNVVAVVFTSYHNTVFKAKREKKEIM